METVVAEAADGAERAVSVLPGGGFVVLDTAVTPELAAEGIANDLIRAVQQARREAGLHVSDRITLAVSADGEVAAALDAHEARVAEATLAEQIVRVDAAVTPITLGDGLTAAVTVAKVTT